METGLELDLKYRVEDMRKHGLEARWTKTSGGAPIIVVRDPRARAAFQRNTWWAVTRDLLASMRRDGVREALESFTLLGDMFSVEI